jgi:acetyl-CoA carboxylase carboxyltransferase component
MTPPQLAEEEAVIRRGGGPAGHARQKKLGRLPVRDRLAKLLDPKSDWLEIGLWAGWGMYDEVGGVPAAGVVTGIGSVSGRSAMIVANDATVKAGAFFPATVKKVLRAQKIAARCNLPILYLVDSAGVYLPLQDEIFPDEDDFGRIFRNNAVLSAAGVPQIAAIMGNCIAGGAYLPVLCDKILMTEGSALCLAGPALVKAAVGQTADAEELGGAAMHAQLSGTIDFREPDDAHCLKRLRELTAMLPADAAPPHGRVPGHKTHGEHDDVRDLLTGIIDADSFSEFKAEFGKPIVCAHATVGGHQVGIVANQRISTRTARGELQIGGVIYHESADKAARFVMTCDEHRLPILFFQDVQGFMVGRDSEQHGIIRSGAKLVNAVSNAAVPKITVIIGGSFGAGHYALCGKAFDPHFIFAWPTARYAVMGPEQAAQTMVSLQKRQENLADAELATLHDKYKADYERQADIRFGAARGWVDAIIAPQDTRHLLIQSLNLATRPPPNGGFRGGVMQV